MTAVPLASVTARVILLIVFSGCRKLPSADTSFPSLGRYWQAISALAIAVPSKLAWMR